MTPHQRYRGLEKAAKILCSLVTIATEVMRGVFCFAGKVVMGNLTV